jgi:hypothetical protein
MENQEWSETRQEELTLGNLKPIVPTGETRVDGAMDRLNELSNLPAIEHVSVFEDVHRRLHESLTNNSE